MLQYFWHHTVDILFTRRRRFVPYPHFPFARLPESFRIQTTVHTIQIQLFLFPVKEPFRAEQLTKNLIQRLWIDYIDWKITTFYGTNKSKFHHTIDIGIVAFECMLNNKHSDPSVVK
jgi:hypothetical protein